MMTISLLLLSLLAVVVLVFPFLEGGGVRNRISYDKNIVLFGVQVSDVVKMFSRGYRKNCQKLKVFTVWIAYLN